tara:strand:- start:444 stop:722 length:279 start_codon:yes stop_codon:yes gene_type:complete
MKNLDNLLNHKIKEVKDMKSMCHNIIKKTDMARLKFKNGRFFDAGSLCIFLPVFLLFPPMVTLVATTLPDDWRSYMFPRHQGTTYYPIYKFW